MASVFVSSGACCSGESFEWCDCSFSITHLVVDGLVSSTGSLVVSNIAQLMSVAFQTASLRPGLFCAKDTVKDPVDVELPVTLNHCHKTQCTPYSMSTVGCGWHVIRGPVDVPPL